jgi:uncharacterized protein
MSPRAAPHIQGATILVTGASSGIGRELARALAPAAGVLVLVARRADRLGALAAELGARHPRLRLALMPCDLVDRAATDAMLDRVAAEVGPVDTLINSAGMGSIGVFDRTDWDQIEQMVRINVLALTYLSWRLLPPMLARRRGGILNVSSGFGREWLPGFAAYAASKHYVTALTETLRAEARSAGVVVSQLCPGPVATEFEAVAKNPTGQEVPGFLQISPERCARAAVAGFARGRAMIIPGVAIVLLLGLGGLVPRSIKRWVYPWVAGWFRRRQGGDAPRRPDGDGDGDGGPEKGVTKTPP